MLAIENLTASRGGTEILRNVNLTVGDGTIVSLIGRNGVGKTTLMKAIMGLVDVKRGDIFFKNINIKNLPPDKRANLGIGYVPQGRGIFPYLTVRENLTVGLDKINKWEMDEVLELFPMLKCIMNRLGGNLSGGQQQQLAIARVLLRKPRLILMDEPTEGIQPSIVSEIQEAIKRINKEKGVAILLVEQYLDFALDVAQSIYVMDCGKIVFEGKAKELDDEQVKSYLTI
ncbi:MAG: urea ABC transporter ATP-binding subunit UrtE [Geminocystis sp.]|nr:urea ABC transporter ATP-binding subunit UrtE [Geminocystis sp.]HIK38859.1 urea ABC transporter ATP-binding subunit UrtE [Geminocystis sp. M7585_C2015_104]MCS7146925.1 urea ABC transporter ATP-binding subunit UrtE [Geminocystis sp.]MCX8077237.1 urea ABC transporter ATP-binding subunit UrtE [Geminocystis sp.]MDW8115749.1 urea ABC transporter ATP-binding subunit UrtE [Geminocystis sp.]